jgi:hypothetical protein
VISGGALIKLESVILHMEKAKIEGAIQALEKK